MFKYIATCLDIFVSYYLNIVCAFLTKRIKIIIINSSITIIITITSQIVIMMYTLLINIENFKLQIIIAIELTTQFVLYF